MQYIYRKNEQHLIENYDTAAKEGFVGWVLHHRLELTFDGHNAASCADLKRMKMYWRRPYFELIYLRLADHTAMHNRANSLDGKYCSPWNKGKKCGPLSEEHKKKIREGNRKPKSEHMRKALREHWKNRPTTKDNHTWFVGVGPDGEKIYVKKE